MKRLKKHELTIEALLNYSPTEFREDIRNDLVVSILSGKAKNRLSLRRIRDRHIYAYKTKHSGELPLEVDAIKIKDPDRFLLSSLYQQTKSLSKTDLKILLAVVESVMVGGRFPYSSAARTTGVSRVRVSRTICKIAQGKADHRLSEVSTIDHFRRLIKKRIKRK